jgi:hypothetical protein
MGDRVVRLALVAGICVAALALQPALAGAATTFHVSPTADGKHEEDCSAAKPCQLQEALAKAKDGDSVSLEAGVYTGAIPFAGVTIEKEIDFGGQPGAPAIFVTTLSKRTHVKPEANAVIHDLRIEGAAGLELESGVAERVYVAYEGVLDPACKLGKGTTMRDSVCWSVEITEEEEGKSHAISIEASGENQDKPVVLRNVTAVTSNSAGDAIHAFGASNAKLNVDAANVIAHSSSGTDIVAEIGTGVKSEAHVNISHSSFVTLDQNPSMATVTSPDASGNVKAVPSFVEPLSGDFHLSAGSAGIDGGIADPLTGSLELDGGPRALPGCFGAGPVPDMGAYERPATAVCPPPPPPPPPPFEPRKPIFRIIQLLLNKKNGGGSLQVEVPSAGTLALTGQGIKLVRRRSAAAGDLLSLPIQPWAITRVRLAKRGKSHVRLKLIFEPRSGPPELMSRGVLLRKTHG